MFHAFLFAGFCGGEATEYEQISNSDESVSFLGLQEDT